MNAALDPGRDSVRLRDILVEQKRNSAQMRELTVRIEVLDLKLTNFAHEIAQQERIAASGKLFAQLRAKRRVEGLARQYAAGLKARESLVREMQRVFDRSRALDVEALGPEMAAEIEGKFKRQA
jgi:hypothetical protein